MHPCPQRLEQALGCKVFYLVFTCFKLLHTWYVTLIRYTATAKWLQSVLEESPAAFVQLRMKNIVQRFNFYFLLQKVILSYKGASIVIEKRSGVSAQIKDINKKACLHAATSMYWILQSKTFAML